ncbi:hypothetical protein MJM95_32240, partial [Salmonella enterica subsp. enterica serovar Anatum]|nr:hypothetical protein [Salmonella enterica subsp. enterica serovar Anatum]
MPLSDSLSELIIGGEADVTRCAVNNGTINIGVVGFIKHEDISCKSEPGLMDTIKTADITVWRMMTNYFAPETLCEI